MATEAGASGGSSELVVKTCDTCGQALPPKAFNTGSDICLGCERPVAIDSMMRALGFIRVREETRESHG